jgi:ParB family chromosome partitioning protein
MVLVPISCCHIEISELCESATNPRKEHDAALEEELVHSIKQSGILQPLLVRENGSRYEVICGNRRLAAARKAGLVDVPCIVRSMTDVEVLQAQLVENLQRVAMHPLDTAEAFQTLASMGLTVQQIASKIGKSTNYVCQRLKLIALTDTQKTEFREGKMNFSQALAVANLPSGMQDVASEEFRSAGVGGTQAQQMVRDYRKSVNAPGSNPGPRKYPPVIKRFREILQFELNDYQIHILEEALEKIERGWK